MMSETEVQQMIDRGLEHHRAGRLADAERVYRQILSSDPNQADAMHLLGLVAVQVGKAQVAVQLIEQAISKRPEFPAAWSNLGYALQAAGRGREAIEAYRRALSFQPDLPQACVNLGNALCEAGEPQEAIEVIRRAIEKSPEDANAHNSLGAALRAAGWLDEAVAEFDRSLSLNPQNAEAHNNLGNALRDLDRPQEAIVHFEQSLILRPDYAQSQNNLAGAFEEQGDYHRAIANYRRAVEMSPQFPMAHVNLGIALLRNGDFENGWREYEWRYQDPEVAPLLRQSKRPVWDGSALNGRRLLIHAEQGLGDIIQFARYVPKVADGGSVTFRVHPELFELMQGMAGAQKVIRMTDPLPEHDLQCPLLSLPRLMKTDLATIPARGAYLKADEERIVCWRERMTPHANKRKIGLVWSGRKQYRNDRRRSIASQLLSRLLEVPDVRLFSLQKNRDESDALDERIVDWTADLHNLADTAAMIAAVDLVISVDTSVAHLAGAMGAPVWVLLPFSPDWRWLLGRDDSPWYPTARLFRQNAPGVWPRVLDRVAAELRGMG